jgi:hypothetical protein
VFFNPKEEDGLFVTGLKFKYAHESVSYEMSLEGEAEGIAWLLKREEAKAAVATTTTGELLLEDMGATVVIDALCSGIIDGTIGPGAAGLIEKILSSTGVEITLEKPLTCVDANNHCSEKLVKVAPEKLPWETVLAASGSSILDIVLGVEFFSECTIFFKVTDSCHAIESSSLLKDGLEGEVLQTFSEAAGTPNAQCSASSGSQGLLETPEAGLMKTTSGEALSI